MIWPLSSFVKLYCSIFDYRYNSRVYIFHQFFQFNPFFCVCVWVFYVARHCHLKKSNLVLFISFPFQIFKPLNSLGRTWLAEEAETRSHAWRLMEMLSHKFYSFGQDTTKARQTMTSDMGSLPPILSLSTDNIFFLFSMFCLSERDCDCLGGFFLPFIYVFFWHFFEIMQRLFGNVKIWVV